MEKFNQTDFNTADLDMDFMAASLWSSSPDVDSFSMPIVDNLLGSPIGSESRSPGVECATTESTYDNYTQQLSPAVTDPVLNLGLDFMNNDTRLDVPSPEEAVKWENVGSPAMLFDLDTSWLNNFSVKVEPTATASSPEQLQAPADVDIDDLEQLLAEEAERQSGQGNTSAEGIAAVITEPAHPHAAVITESAHPHAAVITEPAHPHAAVITEPARAHAMSDAELVGCSVKDLNMRLKGISEADRKSLKQRRRTLKNRGYAQNCRAKRTSARDELEKENSSLRAENKALRKALGEETTARKRQQAQFTALKQLVVASLQQRRA